MIRMEKLLFSLLLLLALATRARSSSWTEKIRDNLNNGLKNIFKRLRDDHELRGRIKDLFGRYAPEDSARHRLTWRIIEGVFVLYDEESHEYIKHEFSDGDRLKACQILQVDCANLTMEELSRLCRRLKSEWHPDRHRGGSKGEEEEARMKFFDIQNACDILKAGNA